MILRTSLALLATVSLSAHALTAADFAGEYFEPKTVFAFSGDENVGVDGFEYYALLDSAELRALPNGDLEINLQSVGRNLHTCSLEGTAKLEGDAFVFRSIADRNNESCTVKLSIDAVSDELRVDAEGEACSYFCGMNASLPEAFPLNSRLNPANPTVPVRVTPRANESLCFMLLSSTSDLREHPTQKVASLYLSLKAGDNPDIINAELVGRKATANPELNFGDSETPADKFRSEATCSAANLYCAFGTNDNSFVVTGTPGSAMVVPNPATGFKLTNGAGATIQLGLDAENANFQMYPATKSHCDSPF